MTFNLEEAEKLQYEIAKKVILVPLNKHPKIIAGVDVAFKIDEAVCVVVIMKYNDLSVLEEIVVKEKISIPYMPGYLSFREGPIIIKALERVKINPDVVLVDGQGIAHPRNAGIATHIGVIKGIVSIGCAKSKLVGKYKEPCLKKGCKSELIYKGKIIGMVLRTKDKVKPLFVSPGHLITLEEAVEIVLNCSTKYRLPEPIRRADFLSKQYKKLG